VAKSRLFDTTVIPMEPAAPRVASAVTTAIVDGGGQMPAGGAPDFQRHLACHDRGIGNGGRSPTGPPRVVVPKLLYRTSEAKVALGVGTSRLYQLINDGTLKARRLGKLTYIEAASLETYVDSLPPVVTPTLAKASPDQDAEPNGTVIPRQSRKGPPPAKRNTDDTELPELADA
jgi:excisionase family DNA binding protein